MNRDFFYLDDDDQQNGPLSINQLGTVNIKPDTLVWTEGLDNWKPAKEVDELQSLMSKKPLAPPPPKAAPTPPITATVIATSVKAKSFICNGCGASLEIPKNARGTVKCKFCNNECVLDGIIKNAEIAAKENINSGIPLSASSSKLHRILVSVLFESPNLPLDIFEKIEVVREERYCIPSYCFYCNATASFTYEVGNERSQTYTVDRGDSVDIREKTRIEWSPGSSTAAVSPIAFAPGNKKFAILIRNLYNGVDPKKLIDIEELDFPANVETYNYDLPQPAAFNEHVIPLIEDMLKKKAKDSIAKLRYANFAMGGSNIQKEAVRVFLGVYHVIYKYNDKEYSLWVSGDGSRWWYDLPPKDIEREKALEDKNQSKENAIASIPSNTYWLTFGMWTCIIVGLGTLPLGFGVLILIGAIIFGVKRSKMKKAFKAKSADINAKFQKDIDAIEGPLSDVKKQFKSQKKALRGIYEKVSGDESAF